MSLDWPAMALLIAAYHYLAHKPLWGSLLIVVSDAFWIAFAIQTQQLPLLIVSFVSGLYAVRAFLTWRAQRGKVVT